MSAANNTNNPVLNAIGVFLQNVATDLATDEKTAMKPVLLSLATGLSANPDVAGLQALGMQLITGTIAAQVQVKGQLAPQVGSLLSALVNSW